MTWKGRLSAAHYSDSGVQARRAAQPRAGAVDAADVPAIDPMGAPASPLVVALAVPPPPSSPSSPPLAAPEPSGGQPRPVMSDAVLALELLLRLEVQLRTAGS